MVESSSHDVSPTFCELEDKLAALSVPRLVLVNERTMRRPADMARAVI
jgi:hypothetical protein